MLLKRVSLPLGFAPANTDDVVRLTGRGRTLARVTWFVVAASMLALLIASIPQFVVLVGVVTEQEQSAAGLLGSLKLFSPSPEFEFWVDVFYNLTSFIASVLCLVLAALIFRLKSGERMAFVVSLTLLLFGIVMTGPSEMLVGQRLAGEAIALFGQMLFWAFLIFLFYIFPDGRFVPGWTRWFAPLLIPWALALGLYQPNNLNSTTILPFMVLYTVPSLTAPAAQIYRYFRVSNAVQRQQTKWVVFGFSVWVLLGTVVTGILIYLSKEFVTDPNAPATAESSLLVFAGRLMWPLSLLCVPLCLTIAILRYRLFEIDVILNRALVYGSLTAIVIAAYLLTVSAFGAILQTRATLAPVLLGSVIVALLIRPLHARLQRGANRLIRLSNRDAEPIMPFPPPIEDSQKHAKPRWLPLAQGIWLMAFAAALIVAIMALPGYARLFTLSQIQPLDAPPTFSAVMDAVIALASIGIVTLCIALAVLLFLRKRTEPIVLLASFFLLAYGIAWGGALESAFTVWQSEQMRILANSIGTFITFMPVLLLLALFPSGQFVPSGMSWVVTASLVLSLFLFFIPPGVPYSPSLATVRDTTLTVLVLVGFSAQVYRYLKVSTAAERQQTKWFVYGLFLSIALGALASLTYPTVLNTPPGGLLPWWTPFGRLSWIAAMAIIPLSLTFGVMRYRMWGIDILLNRALVYGVLTAVIVGVFILIVALLGALFQTSGNLVLSLIATAAVAILFQPLRERLQRGVNRFMYGERDDPYAVIARLGERLELTLAPDALLPTLVETVGHALKLPYVAIELKTVDNRPETPITFPPNTVRPRSVVGFLLVYQHEPIGELIVAPRVGDETLSAADRRLLDTIADQAALAAHTVRLTTDLQHSRERLVTEREQERRRIRRDLHDGLGPALASITLKLDAARNLLPPNAAASEALLKELKTQTQGAIGDIRRLVYDLRPPALDELGLVGALREFASRSRSDELQVSLDVTEPLPLLSAAVEVAAYRVVTEAITNVRRHAHARRCDVSVKADGALQIEIRDDGVGLPTNYQAGVGLISMRERASELGGTCLIESNPGHGTRIVATLPITDL